MNQRLWCIFCLAFLAYSIKLLFDEFYSVNYKIVEEGDKLYDEIKKISACTHCSRIRENNERMGDKAIKLRPRKEDVKSLLNVSIAMIEHRLGVKNLFSVDQSYFFREYVCFLLNQTSYENDPAVINFLKFYTVQLFVHSEGKQPFFYEYVFNNYKNSDSLKISKQKVYGPHYLASSKCLQSTPEHQFLASKLNCLRKCDFSWPADFYLPDSNNNKLFDLVRLMEKEEPGGLNPHFHFEKDSDNETLRKCVKRCPRDDCFSETYNSITVKDDRMKINIESAMYRAYYSTTQFWSQLFGLLTLFTNTSVTSTIPQLMSLAAKKLKTTHRVYFVRFLPKIKIFLILSSSIFILVQSILMIVEYRFEKSFPNRTIIWNYSPEPFSVVVCFPVETLIYNDAAIKKDRNSQTLSNFSFEQLEMRTRAFENGVEEIKLLHGNQEKNLSWTMTEKVLFKNSSFGQMTCLSRCFRLELDFQDLKYRMMLPIYYLIVRFRTEFREVYLVEKHQSFSSGLVDFKGDLFARKMTVKAMEGSRKSNCVKMKKKTSKNKQIDQCINQRFIEKHSALPMKSVVDRDDFGFEINNLKFKETNTTGIEQACMETHRDLKSCREVRFEESMKRINNFDNMTIRLNLNYEDSVSNEIDQSAIKVLLYILNLESIFFKNNIASCLLLLFAILKRGFKLNWSSDKFSRFLVLSVCFLGFLAHNVFIFKGIIDDELAQNGYFETMRQFTIPNVVFCFDLSKLSKLDENHKMTGNHLDNLTKSWRMGNIIQRFVYFNRTHYIEIHTEAGLSNYSNSEITISHFYLQRFYCLEFQLNVKFDEEDFYILINKFILAVFFEDSFTEQVTRTYIFYRQPGQKEISDLLEYDIGPWKKVVKQHPFRPIYEIVLELIQVDRNDEFEGWKDPRRLFFGKRRTADVNDYLNGMQAGFRGGGLENLTTNEIPLNHSNFGKEIDNQLFEQFFLQITNVADHHKPTSLNSKLNYFNFYSKRIDTDYLSFFQFTILPVSKRVEILNKENYAKLIQDILNCLSLWLNISITDLAVYVGWVFNLFSKFYRLLVSVKDKLSSLDCFNSIV